MQGVKEGDVDIIEAIRKRKSIRAFRNTQVPRAVIRDILEAACRAPSAMNTQPWEFTVMTKAVLDSVKSSVIEKFRAGENPHSEHHVYGWATDSVFRHRQVALAKELFRVLDIKREDMDKRTQLMERGLRFFEAPAAIIICVDRNLAEGIGILDIGAVTQNICLAALQYGLGTCIQDQGVMYPEVLRTFCNIADTKRIIIAIAIGYPDGDSLVNQLATPREAVDEITTWCGFD